MVREHKAVFVIGIGAPLHDGKSHDGRAADYDDWSTVNEDGYMGLNGDLLLWNPVLENAFELLTINNFEKVEDDVQNPKIILTVRGLGYKLGEQK